MTNTGNVLEMRFFSATARPNPVLGLEVISEEIANGKHGSVTAVGVVLRGGKGTEIFGLGEESSTALLACLFRQAARRMEDYAIKDITPGVEL